MTKHARRPRRATCEACGKPVSLIDCGVGEHKRTRTLRERLDGRCTGYVYAHDGTGGIECGPDAPVGAGDDVEAYRG